MTRKSTASKDDVLIATQDAAQLMTRRLRQAQIAARRGAEAHIAAKKRVDKDPRLDIREPPSPTAASTASHGALSTGMSTESRAAFEGSQSEAESVQSQRSSASRAMSNSEASQMKAKIYEAMEKLAQAREVAAARRSREAQEEPLVPPPSIEPQVGSTAQAPGAKDPPPREGAAWEAARLEVARALAEGTTPASEPHDSRRPVASETLEADTLRPQKAGSLGLRRHKVREKDNFAAAVQLQLRAQEAMKKRVEKSEISRKQEPSTDSS